MLAYLGHEAGAEATSTREAARVVPQTEVAEHRHDAESLSV
jgi:hypothetical protein